MPPETRSSTSDIIVSFLRSDEFAEIVGEIVKRETEVLQVKISQLCEDMDELKRANSELTQIVSNQKRTSVQKTKTNGSSKELNNGLNKEQAPHNIADGADRATQQIARMQKTADKEPSQKPGTAFINEEKRKTADDLFTLENDSKQTEKWQMPKRRHRRRSAVIYGKDENNALKGVIRYMDYHVFRLHPEVKSEEVIKHLESKNISPVKCEQMKSKYPDEYSSFKVSVPVELEKEFLNPELWPQHVCIDRFLHFIGRRTEKKE